MKGLEVFKISYVIGLFEEFKFKNIFKTVVIFVHGVIYSIFID